ncbi:MAG: hypothetical protein H7836_01810 [Magnetococcus sp. YQC-3]
MKKNLTIGTVALFLALSVSPLMAAETNEHQGHQPAKTEHDHGQGQATPAKADAGDHRDQMEKKMAKMSIKMEKMKRELADAEERMIALKGVLEKAQKTPPGAERNKLLAEHGTGLRTLLAGFRAKTEEMMGKMEQMMGKEKKGGMMGGMDHAGDKKEHGSGSGMMDQEMMDDMAGHHEVMKKRLALLTDLMGQMEAHLAAMSAQQ